MVDLTMVTRIVVMGVSGCGKSTIGRMLADRIGAEFVEGDVLHPAENVTMMSRGEPLTDAARAPWLDAIAARLEAARPPGIIASCSALKRAYRQRLSAKAPVRFIHLALPLETARQRMTSRPRHFMPAALADSQFSTLEGLASDEYGWTLDSTKPLEKLVREILRGLFGVVPFP